MSKKNRRSGRMDPASMRELELMDEAMNQMMTYATRVCVQEYAPGKFMVVGYRAATAPLASGEELVAGLAVRGHEEALVWLDMWMACHLADKQTLEVRIREPRTDLPVPPEH